MYEAKIQEYHSLLELDGIQDDIINVPEAEMILSEYDKCRVDSNMVYTLHENLTNSFM